MKKIITTLAALSAVASAQAVMVAGWDFSQFIGDGFNSTDGATFTQTLSANYSNFDSTFGAGPDSAAYGTLYYNGTRGSSNATVGFDTNQVVPVSNSLNSNFNAPGGAGFDAHETLISEGQQFASAYKFNADAGISLVFEADLSSLGLQGSEWSMSLGGINAGFGDGASVIGVEFSLDGSVYAAAGTINLTSVDTLYTLDLPDTASSKAYVRLTFNEQGSFIDNVAFNAATTSAVPEPSSFAALAGLVGLGFAASRRRRA